VKLAALGAALASLCLIAGSSNPYQVAVPSVVEDDVNSAYWDLRNEGFAVTIDQQFYVDAYVTRQSPAPNSEARRGSVVSLEVRDQGPRGRLPPGGEIVMPSLIGDRLDVATRRLTSLGVLWSLGPLPPLTASTAPTLLENYTVRAQHPRAGRRFVQTKWRVVNNGDLITETRTAGLEAALRREK
jgi:beta-lactam-binding protein with PASTA domain